MQSCIILYTRFRGAQAGLILCGWILFALAVPQCKAVEYDFREHVLAILARVTNNLNLLADTPEGAAFYGERSAIIQRHLENSEYARAWWTLYATPYWTMARRLGGGVECGAEPLCALAVTAGEIVFRWQGEPVLRDCRFDVWFKTDNSARPMVQIRSFLSSRQYWPAQPVYANGSDIIREVEWDGEYFHKTVTVETNRVVWDMRVFSPVAAQALSGGACLVCGWSSQSPRLWDGAAVITAMDNTTTDFNLPPDGADARGRREFKAVRSVAIIGRHGNFKFAVEPLGACAANYKGLTVIANARQGWSFNLNYLPPGQKWPPGELAHFQVVFTADAPRGAPGKN